MRHDQVIDLRDREHRVRTWITVIVAWAVAQHAVLGCCCHHAHGAEAAVCEGHGRADESDHDRHDGPTDADAAAEHDYDGEPDRQHSDDSCPASCGEKCRFAATGRTQFDAATDAVEFTLAAGVPVALVDVFRPKARPDSDDGPPAPPLRLHLLRRVLLI